MEKQIYHAKSDPQFAAPQIDVREQRTRTLDDGTVLPYLYLHGFFAGTALKFSFCFPEKAAYQGRFYQHISPFPGPDEELAALNKTGEEDFIAFALTHGGAYVECNMASDRIFGAANDPTIFYRSNAAVAEFCRDTAQKEFGPHRVYGYAFGGSGGGYKTMSCIENTDAYDGAVPFVIGSPVSLPNCLTVLAHGARVLRNSWSKIVDALEPGGSGDPYQELTPEETDTLREITRMGFPPRMCYVFGTNDDGSLPVLLPGVKGMDPGYFTDFWTVPGYLGTQPGSSAQKDHIHMQTRVTAVLAGVKADTQTAIDGRNGTDDAWQKMLADGGSASLEVTDVPQKDDLFLRGLDMVFLSGAAKGKKLRVGGISGHRIAIGMSYGVDDVQSVLGSIRPGDEILLDNSDYIAIQTYHRHQVPDDLTFHAFDQYRRVDGTPALPQRPTVISYAFTAGGCGSVQDGQVQGKVIVVNNLMDGDFPWQADWYRRKIESVKGADADNWVRLWYNDNAPHGNVSDTGENLRMVSYLGMLRQALVDLAAWVEDGTAPAPSTGYTITPDNQVELSPTATERGGIQPLVHLLANGSEAARVKPGQPVQFSAEITLPAAAGQMENVEWSFEGEQNYPYCGMLDGLTATAEHTYTKPGTYFAVVRVTSNRHPGDVFTRLRNLCRVRVIVEK